MAFFVGDLVEVAKENRTGQKDSEGERAYIQAINNDQGPTIIIQAACHPS